jgi:hypothetical protein
MKPTRKLITHSQLILTSTFLASIDCYNLNSTCIYIVKKKYSQNISKIHVTKTKKVQSLFKLAPRMNIQKKVEKYSKFSSKT